jgi:hypothetical protein
MSERHLASCLVAICCCALLLFALYQRAEVAPIDWKEYKPRAIWGPNPPGGHFPSSTAPNILSFALTRWSQSVRVGHGSILHFGKKLQAKSRYRCS